MDSYMYEFILVALVSLLLNERQYHSELNQIYSTETIQTENLKFKIEKMLIKNYLCSDLVYIYIVMYNANVAYNSF